MGTTPSRGALLNEFGPFTSDRLLNCDLLIVWLRLHVGMIPVLLGDLRQFQIIVDVCVVTGSVDSRLRGVVVVEATLPLGGLRRGSFGNDDLLL